MTKAKPSGKLWMWSLVSVITVFILFFAGFGFLLDVLAMFLVLPVVILMTHIFIILVEEPSLKKRFGQEWIDYTETVPRWLPRHSNTQKDQAPMQSQDGRK